MLFRGEERLEDAGYRLRRNPMAIISDRKGYARAGWQIALPRIGFAKVRIGGFDSDPPARWNGVARVQDQIHDDLLHLARIGDHVGECRAEDQLQFDGFAHDDVEHPIHLAEHGIKTEGPWLNGLA